MDLKNRLDIKIEAVAYDFDIDAFPTAITVKRGEVGINVRVFPNKIQNGLLISLKNPYNPGVSLFGADLPLTKIPVDRLPISFGESIEQEIARIPQGNGPIKITKNQLSHKSRSSLRVPHSNQSSHPICFFFVTGSLNFSFTRLRTRSGTNPSTAPPRLAPSLIVLEETKK